MTIYKKSEETQEKILESAKILFCELGFKKTTIRNIAKRAGVNHALAYYHYNGKYDLAHQIIDEYHQKMEGVFDDIFKEEIDPLLRLLVLYRFDLREIYDKKQDFEFYVDAYQESYFDQDFARECKK